MNNQTTQQPTRLEDPRNRGDFDPRLYPKVNGQDAPAPDATERNDRIKIEFLAAYYGLNCEHARLRALRAQPDTERRREEENNILRAIERLLVVRDGLEDEFAPLGVIAEPVAKNGVTENVIISFGNVDAAGRLRSDGYTITACVPIPLPEGINFDDLPISIEGPGIYSDMHQGPFPRHEPCEN